MYPAIFLDRDGVIIENRPAYVRSWEEVEIFPDAIAALARLVDSPYKIVVITNQAGIGKGLISFQVAADINLRLRQEVAKAGGRIDMIVMCPHKPEDACSCRKPQPGMLLKAAQDLSIDLSQSIMIGDSLTDLQAGNAAGVRSVALVKTGLGDQQIQSVQRELGEADRQQYFIFDTLADALEGLVPPYPSQAESNPSRSS